MFQDQLSGDNNLTSTGLSPAMRLVFILWMFSGVTGGRTSAPPPGGLFDCFIVLFHLCLARLLLTCFLHCLALSQYARVFLLRDLGHYCTRQLLFLLCSFSSLHSEGRNIIRVSMESPRIGYSGWKMDRCVCCKHVLEWWHLGTDSRISWFRFWGKSLIQGCK